MTLVLDLHPMIELTDEQFEQICRKNRDLRLERTAKGELAIMAPTGGETGSYNLELGGQVWLWNRAQEPGQVFDSSTGFTLPNQAIRAPDVAWIRLERWQALTPEQRKTFIPLCPDFVIELQSPSDQRRDLQAKMQEYLKNGLRLGWLIDPGTRQVEIYRPDQPIEVLDNPKTLSGEDVLSGFVLNLSQIFRS